MTNDEIKAVLERVPTWPQDPQQQLTSNPLVRKLIFTGSSKGSGKTPARRSKPLGDA